MQKNKVLALRERIKELDQQSINISKEKEDLDNEINDCLFQEAINAGLFDEFTWEYCPVNSYKGICLYSSEKASNEINKHFGVSWSQYYLEIPNSNFKIDNDSHRMILELSIEAMQTIEKNIKNCRSDKVLAYWNFFKENIINKYKLKMVNKDLKEKLIKEETNLLTVKKNVTDIAYIVNEISIKY